ncbi:MAG TPA: hypothetical protein VFV25_08310, partial [Methylibium sp.]
MIAAAVLLMQGFATPARAFDAEIAAAAHSAAVRPHEAAEALDALANRRGDPAARALAAWERGRLALELGERKTARDLAQGLQAQAEPNQRAAGLLLQALSESTHGNTDAAARDAHAALKLLDQAEGNAALRSDGLRLLSRAIGSGGDLATALHHLEAAGKLAQAEHDPWREIEALLEQAKLQSLYRHTERAGEALAAARRVEEPHHDPVHL